MKRVRPNFFNLTPSQALVFGFLGLIALGTILLCLPLSAADGVEIRPLQALFTSTSAVCVTGLAVVDTGTAYSRFGQVVILCLFQLGGLGIMLFSTALGVRSGDELSGAVPVLFETVSAIATVGLSTGITGNLGSVSMLLICAMMFMGRVGPLTLAAFLFSRSKTKKEIRFPQGEISIG